MDKQVQEAMDLLQEECGEVVQAVSKVRRFGPDFRARGGQRPPSLEELQVEVWDIKIIIDYLERKGVLSDEHFEAYKVGKLERLRQWTNLYDN